MPGRKCIISRDLRIRKADEKDWWIDGLVDWWSAGAGKAARSRGTPGRYPLLDRTKSGRKPDFAGWKPVPSRHILGGNDLVSMGAEKAPDQQQSAGKKHRPQEHAYG